MNKFEDKIKNSLNELDLSNISSDWDDFEGKLAASEKASKVYKWLAIACTLITASTAFILFNQDKTEDPIKKTNVFETANTEQKTQPVAKKLMSIEENAIKTISTQDVESNTIEDSKSIELNAIETRQIEKLVISTSEQESKNIPETIANTTPKLDASFICSKEQLCINETVQFSPISITKNTHYNWSFGDGQTSTEIRPSIYFKSSGNYMISLTTSVNDVQKTKVESIVVHENPQISIHTTEPNTADCQLNHILEATTNHTTSGYWVYNDDKTESHTLSTLFATKGSHEATFVTKNEHGCVTEKTESIEIENDYILGAGNIFSPNGDGMFDTWLPPHLKCDLFKFQLTIISREGKIVFQSSDSNEEWDGSIQGTSQKAKTGEFYGWTITYTDSSNNNRNASGTIIIK